MQYDTIKINGEIYPRPVNFGLQKEDILAAEYQTANGSIHADVVGWRYADLTLSWEALPQPQAAFLDSLRGTVELEVDDPAGTKKYKVQRKAFTAIRHRYPQNGEYIWKNVSITFKFLEASR